MKGITLWQPWAKLVAIGAKKYETRGWKTEYRGPLAIHAAQRKPDPQTLKLCFQEPFLSTLEKAGAIGEIQGNRTLKLPFGQIIAVAQLDVCCVISRNKMLPLDVDGNILWDSVMPLPGEPERSFGDYSSGRYAWLLNDAVRIEPIPYRGFQKLFDIPEDVEKQILNCLT